MIGKTLAHYEITALLGKGGMGEVYRARDTKLGRDVAFKVLPSEMSGDPERLARFDREARTLATLQHANIASIYGFENVGNVRFLVMELVEGDDLSVRLEAGAIDMEEGIDLALQLAQGLAAAHAVGIIHRDLKPANIKLTSEGKLKILDFGLARTFADEQGDSSLEHSPTLTGMTQAGVILGTAAYMAPEQARGKRADHRADIWAFGVVLFEMLTGERLFEGETVSDTLAGVLRAEVPWEQLPKGTPPTVRRLLKRCLDRDPSRRLQAIAEAAIALDDLKAGRVVEAVASTSTKDQKLFKRERFTWVFVVLGLAAAFVAVTWLRDSAPPQPMVQSTLLPPQGWDFAPASPFAVSPDGSQIAFVVIARPENELEVAGSNSIWVRDLSRPEARRLTSVDGDAFPFWSPDGRWLGYFANGKLNKIEVRGGPVVPLCDATDGRGGTWNEDGVIVFQQDWSEGLKKVPAAGGKPEPLTTLNKEHKDVAHRWPQFLPDGQHFLFYVVSTTNPVASEYSGIYIGSLDSGEARLLLPAESRALYARGCLVYRAGTTLMAHAFDASKMELTGDPTPVATDVPGGSVSWGGAQFGVSGDVLLHMRGADAARTQLSWRDRNGKIEGTVGDLAGHWEPSLSNDGSRIAVVIGQDVGDVWIYDLRSEMRTRLTFDPADDRVPLWSPGDSLVAFASTRTGEGQIYVRPVSGESDARLLYTANAVIELNDWSSDGRLIFFSRADPDDGGTDVWALDVHTSEATPVLSGKLEQSGARLSPDNKWLAFTSDESGRSEVYVQSFPQATGRWMVSSDGGANVTYKPMWRSDGRELFYMRGSMLFVVPVASEPAFSFGTPQALFGVSITINTAHYAVSKDGQHILTNELPPANQSKVGARLIQNWHVVLKR